MEDAENPDAGKRLFDNFAISRGKPGKRGRERCKARFFIIFNIYL